MVFVCLLLYFFVEKNSGKMGSTLTVVYKLLYAIVKIFYPLGKAFLNGIVIK